MTTTRIRLLDDHLISQIAAGEVVERPASVVKELVENALDAGATEVRVELEAGGKRRIVVTDDGQGMGAQDALLAFDRHATSKIASFGDLERVATLGFRGEALASIAAVSRLEMRTAETPGDGHIVRIEGGRVRKAEPMSHPRGTRIEVASLFFNVPARRKFLKLPATELRRSIEIVQGYALAHPAVRFVVEHGGRSVLETQAVNDDIEGLRERIGQIFGRELIQRLTEIPLDFVGEDEAITGFVGNRETTRGRRNFLFVNRRLVRDRILLARFYKAVRDTWHGDDYPALFLFLELRPEEVDVNVHPQKAEVRFRSHAFIDRVEQALRATLDAARGAGSAPLSQPSPLPRLPASWEGLGGRPFRRSTDPAALGDGHLPADEVREPEADYAVAAHGAQLGGIARPSFAPIEPSTSPLSGRGKQLPPYRLLGQYKGSLLLLEGHDGLYLVDQHAAHERLHYERLKHTMDSREPCSQRLLEPVMLELAGSEAMRLGELAPALETCGFEVSLMSGNSIALSAIPDVLDADQAETLLQALATSTGDGKDDVEAVQRRILDGLAADLSCKAAIKIHRTMSVEEMQALISDLFDAEQPWACPHGRPTVLRMGDGELERRFGRR